MPDTQQHPEAGQAHPQYGEGSARRPWSGRLLALLTLPENDTLRALRHGVMVTMPLLLAAAVAILINNFPLQPYKDFMLATFGPGWKNPGALVFNSTIHIMALAVCFSLSDSFMTLHNQRHPGQDIMPSIGALAAFSCLFIIFNPEVTADGIIMQWSGLRGLFGTFVVTWLACRVFLALCSIKALRLRFYGEGTDPVLPQIFDTLGPAFCTMGIFLLLRELLNLAGIHSLHQAFYDALRAPFADAQNSFGLGAVYTLLVQISWFFGIHGPDLLDPITHDVFTRGVAANSLALNSGQAPTQIFTKYLFDVYIYMGGSGATLGLLLAVFLRSRDSGSRRIAALSIIPGMFNINELVIFGLPIVFNPAFLLPFLFVPLILLTTTYLAIASSLVPPPVFQTDWTTPPVISALISTGSWRAVVLQLFNLGLSTLIYMPFVSLADEAKKENRKKAFDDLVRTAVTGTRGPSGKRCIDRQGSLGSLARALANDLHAALAAGDGRILLHYQPRVDLVNRRVPCVEALLRWNNPVYGMIPPALAIAIAEDTELTGKLDNIILHLAFEQQKKWREERIFTTISVNVSESQLRDKDFPALIDALYSRHALPADAVMLEVRESLALDPEARYLSALRAIHATGIGIAVDDFGKGYQAISHLKRLPLTELQIDRALIRDIATNKSCQDVIATIQELCYKLGIKTTAEFVESNEQLETLLELNFSTFQGHLFSQPVPADECASFIRTFKK